MAGLNFFDSFEVDIESRLDCRLLGCHHNHLVVGIVKCRSYAGGISHNKGRAVANHSCHSIAPVKVTTGSTKDSCHIQLVFDDVRQLLVAMLAFVAIKNELVFLVQKVSNFLHYGDCIGFFLRMLSQFHEPSKKLLVIGHVEITGHHQVAASPIVLLQKRVAGFNAIFSVCAIAQVPQPNLPREGHVFFKPFSIIEGFLTS